MKTAAIIGFGCAGFSAARALRQADPERIIHIYSTTDEAPYNPMLTTYYVSGRIEESTMFPLGDLETIRRELGAEVFCSCPVTKLRARERELVLADGSVRRYDDVIVTSGAGAVIPPIKGLPDHGLYTMRTAADARKLEKALERGVSSALVVGAQMVGIKVVELLHRRGIRVVLADMEKQMFPASAYATTAAVIAERLERAGIVLKLGSAVMGVTGGEDGRLVSRLGDGSTEETDIVAFCSGIRPNLSFVDREELEVGVGIKTNLRMETSVPHVYAAGDCCETTNILTGKNAYIGLWANSAMEGRVAGCNAAGGDALYQGSLIQNITHYMDTDFISVGDVKAPGRRVFWEKSDGSWRLEATMDGGRMVALNILDNANVSGPVRNVLMHQAAHPGEPMSDSAKLILTRGGVPARIIAQLGGAEI